MKGQADVTGSMIDELHSSDTQGDPMEGESGVTRSILINVMLRISMDIKWKVNVVLLEVSLMNFIPRISNEIKWKVKMVLLEVS